MLKDCQVRIEFTELGSLSDELQTVIKSGLLGADLWILQGALRSDFSAVQNELNIEFIDSRDSNYYFIIPLTDSEFVGRTNYAFVENSDISGNISWPYLRSDNLLRVETALYRCMRETSACERICSCVVVPLLGGVENTDSKFLPDFDKGYSPNHWRVSSYLIGDSLDFSDSVLKFVSDSEIRSYYSDDSSEYELVYAASNANNFKFNSKYVDVIEKVVVELVKEIPELLPYSKNPINSMSDIELRTSDYVVSEVSSTQHAISISEDVLSAIAERGFRTNSLTIRLICRKTD